MTTTGAVRVRAKSPDGFPFATGYDAVVETQQPDGSWQRLRGVTQVDISVRADAFVLATMTVEVAEIDIDAGDAGLLRWSWWQRIVRRFRR
jgi:hypothetical protein